MLPGELKTVEIDTEKNIYRINGEDYNKAQLLEILCLPFKIIIGIEQERKRLSEREYIKINIQTKGGDYYA